MPLIGVAIPSYNHEERIAKSIANTLGKDFDDFKQIIVDDASEDASRQIIRRYDKKSA